MSGSDFSGKKKRLNLKEGVGMAKIAMQVGEEQAAVWANKYFDYYKFFSGLALLVLAVVFLVMRQWALSAVFFGLTHLHVFTNIMFRGMEQVYDKVEEVEKCLKKPSQELSNQKESS